MRGEKKVLLHLATGGGKTLIFCRTLKSMWERGKRGLMVVHGRKLVDQASERLKKEGVPHGIIMAGRPFTLDVPVHVCSIDTITARKLYPPADLIVIDEAHLAGSKSYKILSEKYPDAYYLAVTATPYGTQSLRHIANVVISPISIQGLIDEKYLVRPRYFAPSKPEESDLIAHGRGDFTEQSAEHAMDKPKLYADAISTYQKLGENRPAILFAPTVEMSKYIASQFNAAGIPAAHADANTPDHERKSILEKFEAGKIKVVTNVNIYSTGVDLPFVSCIILFRPTRSTILYIQQCGRGTRTHGNKQDFLIFDHGGNVERLGFITDEFEVSLDGKSKKKGETPIKTCPACYAVVPARVERCLECDHEFEVKPREIEIVESTLEEIEHRPMSNFLQNALYASVISEVKSRMIEGKVNYPIAYAKKVLEKKLGKSASKWFPRLKKDLVLNIQI